MTDYVEWRLSWIRARMAELDRKWRESGYADAGAYWQWVRLYEEGNNLKHQLRS